VALRNATHCAICGGPLCFDVSPRHRLAPSVDHVLPLCELNLTSVEGQRAALSQENLRVSHLGCNARRGSRRYHASKAQRLPERQVPEVWDLNEVAERLRAERATAEASRRW
jgi:hypothetical protein